MTEPLGRCAHCDAPLMMGGFNGPLVCGGCAHALLKVGHAVAELSPGAWQDLGKAGELEREARDEHDDWGRYA